jgi:mRNA degradation ribonuclease J1/J2
VLAGPEFHARGVAGLEGREAELRAEVLAALGEASGAGGEARREVLRLSVRRWFRRATGRRPVVEPVVLTR